jgi:uncharacterized protein
MMVVCPRDGASLVEVNKSGVQIDVCPECKGVWLDRGELEKILQITRDLEREFADPPRAQMPQPIAAQPAARFDGQGDVRAESRPEYRDSRNDDARGYRRDHDDDDDYERDGYGKRKRKSGLSKLFDIFD